MTDIERIAREAGIEFDELGYASASPSELTRFGQLIVAAERERCYDIVMRAPFDQPACEDDGPEVESALKAMAFDITTQIRGFVKPPKPGTQPSLDFSADGA